MENLVPMQYLSNEIYFTQDGWINATDTAKAFGKDIRGYTRSEQYKGYVDALARKLNCVNSTQLQKTVEGRNGGTFLHPKLAVDFARWISPDFAIWCDEVISEKLNQLQKPQSMLDMLAKGFAEMAKLEQKQMEFEEEQKRHSQLLAQTQDQVAHLAGKITDVNTEYYTLAGYYKAQKQQWNMPNNEASKVGKTLKQKSQELGFKVGKTHSQVHGEVNTYHADVLKQILGF